MRELSPKIFDFRINRFLVKKEPAFWIYSSVRFSYAFLYAFKAGEFLKGWGCVFCCILQGLSFPFSSK